MCHSSCLDFVRQVIKPEEVAGRLLIEIGSRNVNGSARDIIAPMGAAEYIGTDKVAGDGVDVVCPVENLLERYGTAVFDGVICTEVLEHCADWRSAIHTLKALVKEGGWIILTTRSRGFPKHDFPVDNWRFSETDMRVIFADCPSKVIAPDMEAPGIFVKAYKPANFIELDLSLYVVYSMSKAANAGNVRDLLFGQAGAQEVR